MAQSRGIYYNSFIAMAMTPSELCKFDGHKVVYSKLPNHVFHSTFGLLSKKFCHFFTLMLSMKILITVLSSSFSVRVCIVSITLARQNVLQCTGTEHSY